MRRSGSKRKRTAKRVLFDLHKQITPNGEKVACCFCGQLLSLESATLEHIIPKSKGGTNNITNLILSCILCNGRRGNLDFDQFKSCKLDCDKYKPKKYKLRKSHKLVEQTKQFPSDVQLMLDQRRAYKERLSLTLFLQNLSKQQ